MVLCDIDEVSSVYNREREREDLIKSLRFSSRGFKRNR